MGISGRETSRPVQLVTGLQTGMTVISIFCLSLAQQTFQYLVPVPVTTCSQLNSYFESKFILPRYFHMSDSDGLWQGVRWRLVYTCPDMPQRGSSLTSNKIRYWFSLVNPMVTLKPWNHLYLDHLINIKTSIGLNSSFQNPDRIACTARTNVSVQRSLPVINDKTVKRF